MWGEEEERKRGTALSRSHPRPLPSTQRTSMDDSRRFRNVGDKRTTLLTTFGKFLLPGQDSRAGLRAANALALPQLTQWIQGRLRSHGAGFPGKAELTPGD